MDAQSLRQNWNQIKGDLQGKYPEASQAFSTQPSDPDALVAAIAQQTGKPENEVRREVEAAVSRSNS